MLVYDVALWCQFPALFVTHNAVVEAPSPFAAIETLMQYTRLRFVAYASAFPHVDRVSLGPQEEWASGEGSVSLPYAAYPPACGYTSPPHFEHGAGPVVGPPLSYRAKRVSVCLNPDGRLTAWPRVKATACCRWCACGCLSCDRSCLLYRPVSSAQPVRPLPVCLLRGRQHVGVGDVVVYRSTYGAATHRPEKGPYRGQVKDIDEMGVWVSDEDGAGGPFLVLFSAVLAVGRVPVDVCAS